MQRMLMLLLVAASQYGWLEFCCETTIVSLSICEDGEGFDEWAVALSLFLSDENDVDLVLRGLSPWYAARSPEERFHILRTAKSMAEEAESGENKNAPI